ncbi:MAG: glycosyltransferase family 4 protein [Lachnospiraceae bacterium]|nr:glycosyltransferase family 4 protein [Lachnospiraceae bacterium]
MDWGTDIIMKILIVKTFPGEIRCDKADYNNQEVGLARALIKCGHQCDIICCADGKPSKKVIHTDYGRDIILYCARAVKVLKNGFFIRSASLFARYDILQVNEYNQMFAWHMAGKYPNKTIIYHGPYYSPFNKRYNLMAKCFDLVFLKRYLRLNTFFITKSRLAEAYLRGKGIENITAVGVGIDREVLSTRREDTLDFLQKAKRNGDKKLIYIGRLEPRRNIFFLLDILKELNKRVRVSLILVGKGDKAYKDDFFRRAKELDLLERIIYREQIEQKYMEQLYGCAEVFLLPTIYDIYGMVLLEAMYFKKAVVTTVNGGSNMMMENGKNGFVIDTFDIAPWCDIIRRLFEDEEYRQKIGDSAHRTVSESYTWEALSGKFLAIYHRMILQK